MALVTLAQLVVPPLLGTWSFALMWVWLAGVLVVFGAEAPVIIAGAFGALFAELAAGMPMGSTVAGFVVGALLYAAAGRFIAIRPLIDRRASEWLTIALDIFVGFVLMTAIAAVAIAFDVLIYGNSVVWQETFIGWYMPQMLFVLGVQLIVIILVLRAVAAFRWHRST